MRSLGRKIKLPRRGFFLKIKNEFFDSSENIFGIFEPNQETVSSQSNFMPCLPEQL